MVLKALQAMTLYLLLLAADEDRCIIVGLVVTIAMGVCTLRAHFLAFSSLVNTCSLQPGNCGRHPKLPQSQPLYTTSYISKMGRLDSDAE